MASDDLKKPLLISSLIAVLMVIQSGLGLLMQEQYRDVAWISATWYGNDWVTLVVAAPLLITSLILTRRGSLRGLLLWAGMLGYSVYNYAYYMYGAALNAFFPIYIVQVMLSVTALVLLLSKVNKNEVAESYHPKTPVRLVGGYLAFVAIGLTCAWMGMWAAYIFAGQPTPVEPEAFKLVTILDIIIMVSMLGIGGVALWRRNQ